jgi:hypothetical protein
MRGTSTGVVRVGEHPRLSVLAGAGGGQLLHPALLLFEKVRNPDPDRDQEITAEYHAFKESQGFTKQEIRAKAAALEGILVPQTEGENLAMLTEAGFSKISKVFQELCWQGYAAEKNARQRLLD